jgi:N-acetylglucosamine-6-sulfatase
MLRGTLSKAMLVGRGAAALSRLALVGGALVLGMSKGISRYRNAYSRGVLGMRKIVLPLALVALVLLLTLGLSGSKPRDAEALTAKPNIVFILADDMRKDDLQYMTQTQALLKDQGMSFENAFVSNALCCPSRATIMRGQYSHNTGVWTNGNSTIGGWQAYKRNGGELDNVATRLQGAGYRTGLFGKYLNGYKATTGKPPGWYKWFAHVNGISYYDYQINDDGTTKQYGSSSTDYEVDVIAEQAETFIDTSATAGVPFFAYVAPIAPHIEEGLGNPVPAPLYEHTYDGLKVTRTLSYNEQDVSDKPSWIRKAPTLTAAQQAEIDVRHENRAESLRSVDDLVAEVVGKLSEKNVLGNTYIFFASDNGFHEGEHRLKTGKWRPYEEDIHMPLLVRGPGVAPGCAIGDTLCRTTYKLALNTDYLPTFTDFACAPDPVLCETLKTQNKWYVPDGRSLRPVLEGNATTTWRNAILLEGSQNTTYVPKSPAYRGIRTVIPGTTTSAGSKYVEYEGTERELYDLGADPLELTNKYVASAPPAELVSRLQTLKTCKGDGCRAAEDGQ